MGRFLFQLFGCGLVFFAFAVIVTRLLPESCTNGDGEQYVDNRGEGRFIKSFRMDSLWVEHNVDSEYGTGMVIHSNFRLRGAKNRTCAMLCYFYGSDYEPLHGTGTNAIFQNSYGDVVTCEYFAPGYNATRYEDFGLIDISGDGKP